MLPFKITHFLKYFFQLSCSKLLIVQDEEGLRKKEGVKSHPPSHSPLPPPTYKGMLFTSTSSRKMANFFLLFSDHVRENIMKRFVIIAQWLAWQLATGVVPGSNPGKGEKLYIFEYSYTPPTQNID